jgi:hypothetical protein
VNTPELPRGVGPAANGPVGRDGVSSGGTRLSRDFLLLLSGSTVSMLGSRVTAIAYPLLVLAITGSPLAAGCSTFLVIAPSALIYLPAGVLVDRWDPRRVMFASELGRFAAVAVIVAVIVLGSPSLILLIVAAATEQTLEVFPILAERRFALSLVDRDRATSALVHSETRSHLVVMLGRPIGAFLFGLGQVVPFCVDSVSFVVSMTALFRISNGRPPERRTVRHAVAEFHSIVRRIPRRVIRADQPDTATEGRMQWRSASVMVGEISAVFAWLRSHSLPLLRFA